MADFSPFEKKMREAGLPPLAIRTFEHYYAQLVAGESGTLSRREIEPVEEMPSAEGLRTRASGEAALGRTVVLKLNGGLGTSMGMTRAKSLLPVKDGLSFLDVIARQILWLREAQGVPVPLLLMNSFRTRDDSLALLAGYEELAGNLPLDFLQHKVPRVRADDLSPIHWPENPEHEWCPPGHGDLYTALFTSGTLDALIGAGLRTAFVSNADNLGAVLDLDLLGWFVESGAPFAMEVKHRTAADRKGGHLALHKDGRLVLRESAQCPDEELGEFGDIELYRFFNTNNLWLDLEALREALAERDGVLGLPMIRNPKPVDPTDPDSPAVIQLETAMGAALSVFPGARAIRVPGHRFAPVKTTSDLLALWSDAYELAPDSRILPSPGAHPADMRIDLDPAHFKRVDQLEAHFPEGAPSLRECRSLSIRGDVHFGADVVVRGDVEIEAPEGRPLRIESGTTLGEPS
ncbi:MAG: UTP--glucose-1-phosphate uridylyltransferase [Deltaproteobacteria bacterium]|jgi:UTP--glucose-1-phosphate uridylyltransferase|nr:UTP--glucose-1-phosphate uridylyltransferase [Deltaproteobacteria bacterium]